MASLRYNSAKLMLLRGVFGDLNGATDLKGTLHTSSYTPDQDAHEFYDDLTNELSTAGGYTSGGFTLANVVVAQDNTNNRATVSADNVVISSATLTFRYMVIRQDTGVAATSPLIALIDFGSNVSVTGADLTFDWDASGVFYVS